MKRVFLFASLFSLACSVIAADRDADLRGARQRECDGDATVAAETYKSVYNDAQAPAHQRTAALCGLLRTDDSRLVSWSKLGLADSDEIRCGTVAQAIALLPAGRIESVRDAWLKELPAEACLKVLRALVHVKNAAARTFLFDALAKCQDVEVRAAALEGIGRIGTAADVPLLLTWMQGSDVKAADAARRGLILINDVKTDAALAGKLKSFEKNAVFLAKLLDVLAVRNALGQAAQIVPFLSHSDDAVRIQAFRVLGQQGMYSEQAAVLAAAMKAKDGKERKEARKAVMKIVRRSGGVQFKAKRIGNCRTEACGVADFNKDGLPDVVAGPYLYLAPEFRPQKIREVESNVKEDGKGYAHDFMNLPLDVNGDGSLDVVSGNWFTKETWWFQNMLPGSGLWPTHVIEKTGNIETGILVDLDGDGKATDFLPDTQHTCLYQLGKGGTLGGHFARDTVSKDKCDMGRGCGDLNGDGRNDILTPDCWYEHCADGSWKKHAYDIGFSDGGRSLGHASNLIVYDVNKDGRNDVIVSSAHKYGIFWYEQLGDRNANGEIQFRRHVIDDTWTQAHYLGWGDIDGDGVPELVTGKRFMAHNGNDPDEYGRLCIFYYDFTPGVNPKFDKYVISFDSEISIGLNVECVDMDGDGDLDLVTTGKWGGPVILENKRLEKKTKEERIKEIAGWLPRNPAADGARVTDRAAWEKLAATGIGKATIKNAEACMNKPVPPAPDSEYLEYSQNGNRSHYQKSLDSRMASFRTLYTAECLENKGRFLPKLIETIDAFCEMKSWTLPAHDASLSCFKGKPHIDLITGAIGLDMAFCYDWLGEKLPAETRAKIMKELDRRVLQPHLRHARGEKIGGQWWFHSRNNWNSVCNANVVRIALAVVNDRNLRAEFVALAEESVPYALSGYTSDGYCSEGMGYWNYGYGHHLAMGLAVRNATDGKVDFFANPKCKEIMKYAYGFQVQSGRSPHFADGGGNAGAPNLALGRLIWPDLSNSAALNSPLMTGSPALFSLRAFGQTPVTGKPTMDVLPNRSWFPDAQVLISRVSHPERTMSLGVAFKGGHNDELHNHNDVGSYYIMLDGVEMGGDPGGEIYTRRTFSKDRYVSNVLNSYGHPVPVVGGKLQSVGRKAAAKILRADMTDEKDVLEIEYASAYAVPALKSLIRTLTFDRTKDEITVTDRIVCSEPTTFEVPVITYRTWKKNEDATQFVFDKCDKTVRKLKMNVQASAPVTFKEEKIENPSLPSPQRLAFSFATPVTEATFTTVFSSR